VIAAALALLLALGPGAQAEPGGPWRSLEGRRAVVFYQGADSLKAARLLRLLDDAPPLPGLPDDVPRDVRVYLAPDDAALQALTGGRVPDWAAGVALPTASTIVMPSTASPRRGAGWSDARTLRHEWAHVGLRQALGAARIPRWFDEGYAEWASGGWTAEEGWRLRLALARREALLDSLRVDWPRGATEARLAYLLAATVVEYLVAESGVRGLEVLVDHWRSEGVFEAALRRTYGLTTGGLESAWRDYVRRRYGWLFTLSHSILLWLGLALLLLLVVHQRRRHDRLRLARLRAQEAPERPAYWLERNLPPAEAGGGPAQHGAGRGDDDLRHGEP